MSWVEGIGGLFDLNRRRLQVRKHPESFAARDQQLRGTLWGRERQRDAELGKPGPARRLPKGAAQPRATLGRVDRLFWITPRWPWTTTPPNAP